MDTQILEDLGLTGAEIKTYLALLDLGSTTAGPILEKAGLHNSVVHRCLHTLATKGLISYVLEGKRKVYAATDPEQFLRYIEEKKQSFTKLLPELKARQQIHKKQEEATLYRGIRGVAQVYHFLVTQKGNEYNTYGGGEECAKRMGLSWWINLHTRRVENKIHARQLFDASVKSQAGAITSKPLTKVRYLSAEFASFQETVIVGDYVAVSVFTENPYSFLMHDAKVAESYRKYFEALWKMAKQ